ncbi:MAG TPA: MFS transporter [Solirubrobacteraceae bacterium]|jgi:MFS family permease|nr:MFS transporter [Solirubrobacteraceae bacterium]
MTRPAPASRLRRHSFGLWVVALAFTTGMAFTTVPTPLWSLYAQRDRFSSLTVTIAFAVYAVAVAVSLYLAGHLSDWYGRRRVLAPALALEIVAAVIFLLWPSLPGLIVARVLTGLGVGVVTATATAWVAELGGAGTRRAQIVATGANLGGLGLGALVSGVLAQFAGHALSLPFLVFIAALVVTCAALFAARETHARSSPPPRYRPQRVSVPSSARARFLAAALGAGITFAIFGLLTSLAPSFLAGTLHEPSRALAGAVAFTVFATAALAQTLTASRTTAQLVAAAIPALLVGLALVTIAVWLPAPSFGVFLAGDVVVGAGAGLMFKGAIATVSEVSSEEHRAEALAALFLAAYIGLAGPVIGLGALTQIASTRVSLLVFAGLLALGILTATPALLARGERQPASPPPSSPPERSDHVPDTADHDPARPDRHGHHPRRVWSVGDRWRRVGVWLGSAGR